MRTEQIIGVMKKKAIDGGALQPLERLSKSVGDGFNRRDTWDLGDNAKFIVRSREAAQHRLAFAVSGGGVEDANACGRSTRQDRLDFGFSGPASGIRDAVVQAELNRAET